MVATVELSGTVKDDNGTAVASATVTLADEQGQTLATTTTDGTGAYRFGLAPATTKVVLTVTSSAYGPRSQAFMTNTESMSLDFTGALALTNRPEVIKVTPANAATGISPTNPIELVFSLPVDKASVMAAFALQVNNDSPVSLPSGFLLPAGNWPPSNTTAVLDSSHFEPTWLGSTTLTLTPKVPIPTTSANGLNYRITLSYNSNVIRSLSGREAQPGVVGDHNNGPFKFGTNKPYTTFAVAPLQSSSSMRIIGARVNGHQIRMQFSQPLFWDVVTGRIAGGASGAATHAAGANGDITGVQAAANYEIQVNGGGYQAFTPVNFPGASAYFDNSDPTHQTVILTTNAPIAAVGAAVDVRVVNSIMSATGSSLSLNGSANIGSATAV